MGLVYAPATGSLTFAEDGAAPPAGPVLPLRWELLALLAAGAAAVFEGHADLRTDVPATKLLSKVVYRLLVQRGPRRSASYGTARAIVTRGERGGRVKEGANGAAVDTPFPPLYHAADTMMPSYDSLRARHLFEAMRARYGAAAGVGGAAACSRGMTPAFLSFGRSDVSFLISAQVGPDIGGGGCQRRQLRPLRVCSSTAASAR